MKRIKINKILEKKGKVPITCLTSYTKTITKILDKYCDIILVGDSLGMVLYGMKNTKEVTLKTMISHAKSVRLGVKKSLLVVDMPVKTYSNKKIAYKNAKAIIKHTKCDAIKLEGGKKIIDIVKHLVQKGINVMGHVGLLPQYSSNYKVKGKSHVQRLNILNDAKALSKAGVFAIVIECVVENLAKEITQSVVVPTIGIGASKHCDGQILVTDDLIGLSEYQPRFVKRYGRIDKIIEQSVKKYCKDVKNKKFPFTKNVYQK